MGVMNSHLWPPKDWRAFIALIFSILGAIALTSFAAWLVWILWLGGWPIATAEKRIEIFGQALLLLLAGALLVLLSLGLAINRRTLKIGKDGLEASGGEADDD